MGDKTLFAVFVVVYMALYMCVNYLRIQSHVLYTTTNAANEVSYASSYRADYILSHWSPKFIAFLVFSIFCRLSYAMSKFRTYLGKQSIRFFFSNTTLSIIFTLSKFVSNGMSMSEKRYSTVYWVMVFSHMLCVCVHFWIFECIL